MGEFPYHTALSFTALSFMKDSSDLYHIQSFGVSFKRCYRTACGTLNSGIFCVLTNVFNMFYYILVTWAWHLSSFLDIYQCFFLNSWSLVVFITYFWIVLAFVCTRFCSPCPGERKKALCQTVLGWLSLGVSLDSWAWTYIVSFDLPHL